MSLLTVVIGLGGLILLLYALILEWIFYYWKKKYVRSKRTSTLPHVSIVIAARNEEASIRQCLDALLAQSYPAEKYEIIIVDDHSEDQTVTQIEQAKSNIELGLKIRLLKTEKPGKKSAINLGVQSAKNDVILTTDADCKVGQRWVENMVNALKSEELDLVTGKVIGISKASAFQHFQSLDILGTMGLTAAGIRSGRFILANGANMIFKRELFLQYESERVENFASGDDVFLAKWIHENRSQSLGFNQDKKATVYTSVEDNVYDFLQQRIRWASKTRAYATWSLLIIMIIVGVAAFLFWLFGILAIFLGAYFIWVFLIYTFLKMAIEARYLMHISEREHKMQLLKNFPICFLFNQAYISIMPLLSLLNKNYNWKGRKTQ